MAAFCAQARTMTLAQCQQTALENNETMTVSANKLLQAKLDQKIAFASYLPQVDIAGGVMAMKDQEFSGMTLQTTGAWMAGLTIAQPIYVGGKIRAANKLAGIGRQVAEESMRRDSMDVIAEVNRAYYTLISVESKVRMLESYRDRLRSLYESVKVSVDAEIAIRNDLLRVRTSMTDIEYQLQKAGNGAEMCRMALASAMGTDDYDIQVADTMLVYELPPMSADISERPETLLLEKQIEASKRQVDMARADMLPTIAISAGYSLYGGIRMKGFAALPDGSYMPYTQKMHDDIPNAMLSVSIPVWHWKSDYNKMKKAKLDVENAVLERERNTRLMTIEVNSNIRNVVDSRRMIETAELGVEQADENLKVMRSLFDNGMATLTDLLDAQSQWHSARSNLIEARMQFKSYETDYLRSVGKLRTESK